jgi:nicotinate phosphoribosyltransferase
MIIESLLDTDLYKFTMMQAVLHRFPAAEVEYGFRCRTRGTALQVSAVDLRREIVALCRIGFRKRETEYLRSLRFLKSDFVDILKIFRLQEEYVRVSEDDGALQIAIKGPWLHTILFEVPVLAIVSELHATASGRGDDVLRTGSERLEAKIAQVQALGNDTDFRFAEFGTRRRFSRAWRAA